MSRHGDIIVVVVRPIEWKFAYLVMINLCV